MINLKEKKVLLIAPEFNGYENEIIVALQSKGASVDFFQEKINNTTSKYLSKYMKGMYKKVQTNHLDYILENVQTEYDYLLLIRGELLDSDFFSKLFQRSHIKHKIMYQWDSIKAVPNILNVIKYFDKVLSFDYNDCANGDIDYLPLFYVNAFIPDNKIKPIYDFSFVGKFHSDRHKYLIDIKRFAEERGLTINIKMKMSPFRFAFKKLFDSSFQNISLNDVIFKNISLEQVALIVNQSKILIDVVNELQSGLSIRTFEVLGSNKKLLTNNKNIQNEKFYNLNCICMIENLNDEFIDSKCHLEDFQEYGIDSWLNKLLTNMKQ